MFLLDNVFTFFALSQPTDFPLSNLVSFPHQQQDKEKRGNLHDSHHSVCPAESQVGHPRCDIEGDGQSETDAEYIENDRSLSRVLGKYLAGIASCR